MSLHVTKKISPGLLDNIAVTSRKFVPNFSGVFPRLKNFFYFQNIFLNQMVFELTWVSPTWKFPNNPRPLSTYTISRCHYFRGHTLVPLRCSKNPSHLSHQKPPPQLYLKINSTKLPNGSLMHIDHSHAKQCHNPMQ